MNDEITRLLNAVDDVISANERRRYWSSPGRKYDRKDELIENRNDAIEQFYKSLERLAEARKNVA